MKKFIPIAGLILSMTAISVSAKTEITKNELNINTGVLTVEGVTDTITDTTANTKIATISLNIPKKGITAEQLQASNNAVDSILYCEQKSSNENGEFSFTVTFSNTDPEGVYEVYVGDEFGNDADTDSLYFLSATSHESAVNALNSAATSAENSDQPAFNTAFNANKDKLFYYPDIIAQNDDVIKKIIFSYAKESGFSTTDSALNMSIYKTALVAQLIKDGRLSDAKTLFDEMYILDNGDIESYGATADCNTYINTDTKCEYFAGVFEECNSLESFEEAFTDAMILTIVKHPGNVANIETIFKKYKNYLGANTDYASLSNYSSIAGITYENIESCVLAFNSSVSSPGNIIISGGSNNSSKDSGVSFPGVVSGNTTPGKIDIKFEDLNSVQWAYTSISELFERKIISGKSETRFAPNDRVKREEYAKMLVAMSNVEINDGINVFSDVENDAWYKSYVNTAYEKGFCNGIGNGAFGIGMEIKRQDMCVMAYNVLKALGCEIPDGELTFDDASEIGEYAKAPVAALNKAGIVNGVGNNKFNPSGSATRAEAAVIIYNTLMYWIGGSAK